MGEYDTLRLEHFSVEIRKTMISAKRSLNQDLLLRFRNPYKSKIDSHHFFGECMVTKIHHIGENVLFFPTKVFMV
jgi:hypothetical protein